MTDLTDPRALAIARGRALDLIADLFQRGPRAERLDALRAVDALRPHLEVPFDADQAAADHHEALHLQLFPYASVFLSEDAQLGGGVSAAARAAMALGGFSPELSGGEPDHLGSQLAYLRHLAGAEADAWRDGRPEVVQRLDGLTRRFLDGHVLRWLPPLVVALEDLEQPLYANAAALALELVGSWRAELGGEAEAWDLPEAPALLDDPKTGLKRISKHLAVPAYAGAFLTQAHLRRLGRGLELPQGFGKRWQLLENLLQAAVQYEKLDALLEGMQARLAADRARLAALNAHGSLPVGPWRRRLEVTEGLLGRMRAEARP